MSRVLVLLSGGLDSSTLACSLLKKGFSVEGLFINYGQAMHKAEKRASEYIASWAGFKLKTLEFPLDKCLVSGCLFDDGPKDWQTHFVSFLPQRNLLLLTIAAMYAQQSGMENIYIGVIKIPATPFPDTTVDFIKTAQEAIRVSYPVAAIHYPFVDMDKASVVSLALKMGLPIDATFSCEMSSDHHCMKCPSCLDRYWALET